MSKWPKVSIIILNWNNYEDTKKCLESLEKITYPNYEIMVVDNGSTDNSGEMLREEFPKYSYIFNKKNLGFAAGNNVGIKRAMENGADYVLILNNDTGVDPSFLTELVKVAESDDDIAIVSPIIYRYDERDKVWCSGAEIDRNSGIGRKLVDKFPSDIRFTGYASGCASLIKSTVIEKVGMYDPDYFMSAEDADLGIRVRDAGYRIAVVSQAKIWHKHGGSFKDGPKSPYFVYYEYKNRLLLARKNAIGRQWIWHIPRILFFYSKSILAMFIKQKQPALAFSILAGIKDFIMRKYGKREWQ